jgi:hypothetical protein
VSVKPPHANVLVEASHRGFAKGPLAKLFGEGPPKRSCFGRGDVGEVTEDGSEAPHVKVLEKAMSM